jgi:hypothetical protein
MLKLRFLILGVLISVLGCHREHHAEEEHFDQKIIADLAPEFKVPSVVWDLLEGKKQVDSHRKIVPNPEASKGVDESIIVGIKVRLKEKTEGILGGKDLEFKAPKSGLNLDLARYLRLNKGTFTLSFEPEESIDPNMAKVFFLSQSIKRELDHQPLGGGCDAYFDITKSYLKEMKSRGIEVNVTDGRHVSLLAGTFLIRVSQEKGVSRITHLTLTDSRLPELLCDRVSGEEEKE